MTPPHDDVHHTIQLDGTRYRATAKRQGDGRWLVTKLLIECPEGIASGTLRRVPLARIDAELNRARWSPLLTGSMPGLRLDRGTQATAPEAFYYSVAKAYAKLADAGESPAPALAKVNTVSERTVHGWVSRARARGFLPPGRKGRVG